LPKDLPDGLGVNFAWHFEPCDELGGDILNVLPLSNQSVAMYLLDVTGHGVPAALLSVTLSRVLTTRDPSSSILITQNADADVTTIRPPGEVLSYLNRQFPMDAQGGRFFTMLYGVLDSDTGLLRYANAGHPPPILAPRGTTPRQLSGGNLPIGIVSGVEYEEARVQLEPGDRLYFYSDGITEATCGRGEMLQADGLIQLIARARSDTLAADLATTVLDLKQWCGPEPLGDDVSLLGLERILES
jgi:sigma-B regulation protein RsbU (phosphoserine phosphatase)